MGIRNFFCRDQVSVVHFTTTELASMGIEEILNKDSIRCQRIDKNDVHILIHGNSDLVIETDFKYTIAVMISVGIPDRAIVTIGDGPIHVQFSESSLPARIAYLHRG